MSSTAISINLAKTVVGAGVLALPFAYKCQGIVLATLSIILAGLLTVIGLLFQAYSAGFLPKGSASFYNVSRLSFPKLATVFDACVAIKTFGVSVSYLIIIGNLMPVIAADLGAGQDSIFCLRFFWLVVAMLIAAPLCFLKTLEKLKYTSLIGLASVGYLTVLVVAHFVLGDTIRYRGPVRYLQPEQFNSLLASLPIIIFAFTCAQNMFSALNELENDGLPNILAVLAVSLGTPALLYVLVGLTGYLSFGDYVGDNIIAMYPPSLTSLLGRVAIVILVLFSYPVQVHPARTSTINVVLAFIEPEAHHTAGEHAVEASGLLPTAENAIEDNVSLLDAPKDVAPVHPVIFYLVTSVLCLASFAIAAGVRSLELVLSLVGATGGTAISFILPGVFASALAFRESSNRIMELDLQQRRTLSVAAKALSILGGVIMVLSLFSIVTKAK